MKVIFTEKTRRRRRGLSISRKQADGERKVSSAAKISTYNESLSKKQEEGELFFPEGRDACKLFADSGVSQKKAKFTEMQANLGEGRRWTFA